MAECSFDGCDRAAAVRGLCKAHDNQRRRGTELHAIGKRPARPCGFEGCDAKHYGNGLCRDHWIAAKTAERRSNRNARREMDRIHYLKNREAMRAKARAYYAANRAKRISQMEAWRQANPESTVAKRQARIARLRNAPGRGVQTADWRRILDHHGHACFYCGAKGIGLHQEHRIPLSRGGAHDPTNVVPACPPCNWKKGTMTDAEFMAARMAG